MPIAFARLRPRMSPMYSATLFVESPRNLPIFATMCPSGLRITAPAPAGPGFLRGLDGVALALLGGGPVAAALVPLGLREVHRLVDLLRGALRRLLDVALLADLDALRPGAGRGLARLLRLLDAVRGGGEELAERVAVVPGVARQRPRQVLVRRHEAEQLREDRLRGGLRDGLRHGLGGRRRGRVDRLGRVDDAMAARARLDRVRLLQRDGELGGDVAVAPLARHPDDRRDRDARAAALDVLVLGEEGGIDLLHRVRAPQREARELLLGLGPLLRDLLDLGLGGGLPVGELLLLLVERPADLARLGGELLHVLRLAVVGLLRDLDLAGERGILAGSADLAEPPLPLLHLVALHPEQGLELAPLALVRVEAGLLLLPGLAGGHDTGLDLRLAGLMAGDRRLDLVHVEIDLLQLLQRLQLLTQRQGSRPLVSWAHQDSNLDLIGYEPTALAVEQWALRPFPVRLRLPRSASSRRSSSAASTARGAAASAAPSPRSGGCARGSPRSPDRPPRACGRSSPRCRTASGGPSPHGGSGWRAPSGSAPRGSC